MYNGQGNFNNAIKLYQYLIQDQPNSYEILRYQARIVNATYQKQDKKQTVKEVERMLGLYEKVGSTAPADWMATFKDDMEKELRTISTTWHREADKQGQHDPRIGGRYVSGTLRLFPENKYAYAITMNKALMLKSLERYEEAETPLRRSSHSTPMESTQKRQPTRPCLPITP